MKPSERLLQKCPMKTDLAKYVLNVLGENLDAITQGPGPKGTLEQMLAIHEQMESALELAVDTEVRLLEAEPEPKGAHPVEVLFSVLQKKAEEHRAAQEAEEIHCKVVRCAKCQTKLIFEDSAVDGHRKAICPGCGDTNLVRIPESEV